MKNNEDNKDNKDNKENNKKKIKNKNEVEGLFTMAWGPAQWESLHNITFNYPYNPSNRDKKNYYKYFMALSEVLPCCICKKHYKEHILSGKHILDKKVFKNRETLTKWLYELHKHVCELVGYSYDITYEMLCKKHNSYIAKCEFTNEQKKNAYKNVYDVHAPVVQEDILEHFVGYAKEMGLKNFDKNIKKYSSMDRESEEWYERNQICQEMIKQMRIKGILGMDKNCVLTLEELKLMEYCSTTLPKFAILRALEKMGCKIKKKYKFNK